MKVKFITCIYSDLNGTELGGRRSRGRHYRWSLLSHLKMTDADFLCYTSKQEFSELCDFFYSRHAISKAQLQIKVFNLNKTRFKPLIDRYKNIDNTKSGDRCIEIQWSKFTWWKNENKLYDYYFWIDAGLSYTGLIPDKYMDSSIAEGQYYTSTLFNNTLLKNLTRVSTDKFLICSKENDRNFWEHTLDPKFYNDYDRSRHIIGGLFGGHRDLWDNITNLFEKYIKVVIPETKTLYHEESIMTLMYFNHKELFNPQEFDIFVHENNVTSDKPANYTTINKSFYKILEELNENTV